MVQWILGVDQLVRQPPGVTITDADFINANSHVAVDETSTLAGSVSIEGAPELQASQSLMLVSGGYEAPSITITNAGAITWILNLGRKCTYCGRIAMQPPLGPPGGP